METTHYLKGQPVTIIARENRREVWIETADKRILRVFKAGLSTTTPIGTVALSGLKVDTRGSDGAR
jgi:hypothetical protein